ncbi:hypothetical protein ACH46N_21375 [Streptomyces pristinaespiralis]|uniref:hypothetical protein n=1 Tax=Streptomyces pristinaespiralis TaxID=38300 RepID=UPI001319BB9D|nr:hypothetical protein [Streptomyces pristinaespiralis]QMU15941.1 hypothetical protein H3L99_21935 [Streptomyces pristinaespiralis]
MDELPGNDGLSVTDTVNQPDWRDDETLSAQIRAMTRQQRHQAAYLALRRLQAPLLDIAMPVEWGVDSAALTSVLREGATRLDGEVNEDLGHAIAELCSAPLFESEIEPEFAESFQLEVINGWLMLGESLGEMSEVQTDRAISLAREMAVYLDSYMDGSLTVVEGDELRERYLARVADNLRVYGLGYFGTRNLEIEGACHAAIIAVSASEDLLGSAVGHQLEATCDEYSSQISSALRAFTQ